MLLGPNVTDVFGYYTMVVQVKEPRTILPDRFIGEQSTLYSITGKATALYSITSKAPLFTASPVRLHCLQHHW